MPLAASISPLTRRNQFRGIAHAMVSWETLKWRAVMSRDGKDIFNDSNCTAESNVGAATILLLRLMSIPASAFFPARSTPDGWSCLAVM